MLGATSSHTMLALQQPELMPLSKSTHPDIKRYLLHPDECISEFTEPDRTEITKRTTASKSWNPFNGSIQAFQKNKIDKPSQVIPEKIPDDVVVLLVNNRHPSIVLGGFDSTQSNPNAKADMEKHIFSWFPKDAGNANTKMYIAAAGATAVNEAIYQFLKAKELPCPRPLAGLMCLATVSMIAYTDNPLKDMIISSLSTRGRNSPSIHDRVAAIPMKGLDVKAMQDKAEEIKKKGEFFMLGTNCSRSVLEILKAGLPKDAIKSLKEPAGWVTPTDVENIADFLAEQHMVERGTIDPEGNVVF